MAQYVWRTMKVHFIKYLATLTIVLAIMTSPAIAAQATPTKTVADFQSTLLGVMKEASSLSVQQRYDRLAPAVIKAFHLPLMAQIATGRSWNKATQDEQIKVVSAFRRMSVSTLATLFDGYSGEMFNVIAEKPGPSKTTLVITQLAKTDGGVVNIAYVMRKFTENWQIIDVIIDSGISELKVRRSEYNLVLKESGLAGLIGLLNHKADELVAR